MSENLTYSGTLTIVTCWCGMRHGVPEELYDFQQREHRDGRDRFIHCPLGHKYAPAGEGDAARLQRQVERLQNTTEQLRAERDHYERSRNATRGHLTRTKKRIAAGVCPCCKRSFDDLASHMKTKHPAYAEDKP